VGSFSNTQNTVKRKMKYLIGNNTVNLTHCVDEIYNSPFEPINFRQWMSSNVAKEPALRFLQSNSYKIDEKCEFDRVTFWYFINCKYYLKPKQMTEFVLRFT
jgi:hypothetical protein